MAVPSLGSIPVKKSSNSKKYISKGLITGGKSSFDVTLSKMQHRGWTKNGERLVFEIRCDGIPKKHHLCQAYYHVLVEKSPKRVQVSFENVIKNKVTIKRMKKALTASKFFGQPKVVFNTRSKDLLLEIPFKNDVKVSAFQVPGGKKPFQVVVDVKGAP